MSVHVQALWYPMAVSATILLVYLLVSLPPITLYVYSVQYISKLPWVGKTKVRGTAVACLSFNINITILITRLCLLSAR